MATTATDFGAKLEAPLLRPTSAPHLRWGRTPPAFLAASSRQPLPSDVGEAIAAYLRDGRPEPFEGARNAFLRARHRTGG